MSGRTNRGVRRRRECVAAAIAIAAMLVFGLALLLTGCGGSGGGLYGGGSATTAGTSSSATSVTTAASGTTVPTTAGGAGGATTQVALQNFQIVPATVTIKAGDSITWTNKDSTTHRLVGDKNEFDSGDIAAGATFAFTFKTAGAVAYHCSIHPSMIGTITVQ